MFRNNNDKCNALRDILDRGPTAIDGFVSYEYGLCAPKPLDKLENKPYSLWEDWALYLPELYRIGKYHAFFNQQPVLSADELDDRDLLRANQILGLCAHAVVHFSDEDE